MHSRVCPTVYKIKSYRYNSAFMQSMQVKNASHAPRYSHVLHTSTWYLSPVPRCLPNGILNRHLYDDSACAFTRYASHGLVVGKQSSMPHNQPALSYKPEIIPPYISICTLLYRGIVQTCNHNLGFSLIAYDNNFKELFTPNRCTVSRTSYLTWQHDGCMV
jgi:hypothetical protein